MLGLPRQAVDSPDHSEDDRQLSIAELQGDPLHHVMAHLDTKSLCSAVQVGALVQRFGVQKLARCRFAKRLVSMQHSASKDHPTSSCCQQDVTISSGKKLHQASGPKAPCVSALIIRLTRLTFEARGESDLRPAASSHIALVRDHADHEYNPEGQMQPDSSELVASLRPRGTSLLVDTPGHFQGVFDVSLESSGILWPKVGYSFDTSLVFCYANSVVQPPNEDIEGDYRCVELFKVPAGRLFRDVLLENCTTFQLPQEPEERLQAETRTNSRFLWHSVPSTLRERSEWWGQSVP